MYSQYDIDAHNRDLNRSSGDRNTTLYNENTQNDIQQEYHISSMSGCDGLAPPTMSFDEDLGPDMDLAQLSLGSRSRGTTVRAATAGFYPEQASFMSSDSLLVPPSLLAPSKSFMASPYAKNPIRDFAPDPFRKSVSDASLGPVAEEPPRIQPKRLECGPIRGRMVLMNSAATAKKLWDAVRVLFGVFGVTILAEKPGKCVVRGSYASGYAICNFDAQIWETASGLGLEFRNRQRGGRTALTDLVQRTAHGLLKQGLASQMSHGDDILPPISELMSDSSSADSESSSDEGMGDMLLDDGLGMPTLGVNAVGCCYRGASGIRVDSDEDLQDWIRMLEEGGGCLADTLTTIAKAAEVSSNAEIMCRSEALVIAVASVLSREASGKASSREQQVSLAALRLIENLATWAQNHGEMPGLLVLQNPTGDQNQYPCSLQGVIEHAKQSVAQNGTLQATAIRTLQNVFSSRSQFQCQKAAYQDQLMRAQLLSSLENEEFDAQCQKEFQQLRQVLMVEVA